MKQSDFKRNLFYTVQVAGVSFSLISIAVNLITGLPLTVNIKWILLIVITVIIMAIIKRRPDTGHLFFLYLIFIIVVFMPYGFIDAGGGSSDYIAYSFFVLLVVTYILEGRYQKICVVLLITVFVTLHVFEHLYPKTIPVYSELSRFYDRLIQVPMMLLFSYVVIGRFAKAYNESNKKLFHYANYDMLTGLLNRWALNDILKKSSACHIAQATCFF